MTGYVYRGGDQQQVAPRRQAVARQTARAGQVPLDRIAFHPHNVRRDLGDLRALTESIEMHGVVTPVVLERRGETFRIRDGHRRVAAARLAGVASVLAVVHGEALDDGEWVRNSIAANHHRADLDKAERRDVIKRLRDDGLTWTEIAAEYGCAPNTVRHWASEETPSSSPARRRVSRRQLVDLIDELRANLDELTAAEVLDRFHALVNGEAP